MLEEYFRVNILAAIFYNILGSQYFILLNLVFMARPLQIEYDGALYHVTSRGNERKAIFRDDTDPELLLGTPFQATQRFDSLCYATV